MWLPTPPIVMRQFVAFCSQSGACCMTIGPDSDTLLPGGLCHAEALPGSGAACSQIEGAWYLVPTVLRTAGLPRDLFDQTRILVSTSELFALWRAIETVSSDPLIGLRLGVETKTERFHPMGIAALSTQNLVRQQSIWPATRS